MQMSVPADAGARRAERFRLRSILQRGVDRQAHAAGSFDGLTLRRFAGCGRIIHAKDGKAAIRVTHGDDGPNAYLTGVRTCGSVWMCSVCAAKIRARRSIEVATVAEAHCNGGGHVGMLTLTVRHRPSHTLRQLMDAQAAAWRSLQQSADWRALREVDGLIGTVRSWEITQSFQRLGNAVGSWHPHFHVLLLWDGDVIDPERAAEAVAWIERAWAQRIENRLGCRPNEHGFDYRPLEAGAAAYVAKIGHEMARNDLKGSADVFDLLAELEDGEAWVWHRVEEYAATTAGRRAIQFSRGLRERFGLDAELSDEELAAQEVDGEHVLDIGRNWLRRLMAYRRGAPPRIVELLADIEASEYAKRPRCTSAEDIQPGPLVRAG
jgi:hypothetical protein